MVVTSSNSKAAGSSVMRGCSAVRAALPWTAKLMCEVQSGRWW